MEDLKAGSIIGGYKLEEEIARGGMGTIFRAQHAEIESTVAVKILKDDLASRPDIIKRFLREGRLIARLDHAGIIKIFDVGRQGELYYLVMEYVEGKDLQHLLDEKGPFDPDHALSIAHKVALTLDYAHDSGIVHRDIKPSNLILSRNGQVFITDFGIARLLEQDTAITKTGALIGTPTHMSPEQCRGSTVDSRSDIYSLGATLYTLLSGKPPFSSKSPARLISQLLHENPPPLEAIVPNLSPNVVGVVKRMMAKHPAARFQTGKETANALHAARDPHHQHQQTDEEPRRRYKTATTDSKAFTAGVLAVACILVVGIAGLLMWFEINESLADSKSTTVESSLTNNRQDPSRDPVANQSRERKSPDKNANSNADNETPKLSMRELKARLTRRVNAFQNALLTGDTHRAYRFVDPTIRKDPNLLLSLGRISQSIDALGPGTTAEHTLTMDERKADVIFVFKRDKYVMHFPGTWIHRNGIWFLKPQGEIPIK